MRFIREATFILVGVIALCASLPAFGDDAGRRAGEQGPCASDQYLATVYTMSTCVPLKLKSSVIEAHKSPPGQYGLVFLNLSGASEQEKLCLRCHRRGKPIPPLGLGSAGGWR